MLANQHSGSLRWYGKRDTLRWDFIAPERFVTDSPAHLLRGMLRAWPLHEQRAFFEDDLRIPLAQPSSGHAMLAAGVAALVLVGGTLMGWRSRTGRRIGEAGVTQRAS